MILLFMKVLALTRSGRCRRSAVHRRALGPKLRRRGSFTAGVLREAYFSADEHEAVLMLECGGADEARSHLAGLPLVKAGLIDFEIIPLVPYSGFTRLFAEKP